MRNAETMTRFQLEEEFIGFLLRWNKYILTTKINSRYLQNEDFKIILDTIKELMRNNKCVDYTLAYELNNKFNIKLAIETLNNFLDLDENLNAERIKSIEDKIFEYYKEDYYRFLEKELKNKKITRQEFIKKQVEVNKIKINISANAMLTTDVELEQDDGVYVKSGTTLLDTNIRGFKLGELSVWSGANGSAKSTYLNQVAIESLEQNYNVAIYSGELKADRLLKWLIKQMAGSHNMYLTDYYGTKYPKVKKTMEDKIRNFYFKKIFIYNNELGHFSDEVIDTLRDCVKKNNVKVIIIDNLMSLDLTKYDENVYQSQSIFIQKLCDLAKDENVHIHFVCHPRKSTTFLRKTDISGTADLTNKADNVFILHRVNKDFERATKEMFHWREDNEIYNYTNVLEICKNRDLGVQDLFVGMYYDEISKRLKNSIEEVKKYRWELV